MKMRKKLAALLAAAMIVSVMPMTAFAASTNRVTQVVQVVKDGNTTSITPDLKIKLDDDLKANSKFYVKLENAKWVAGTTVGVTTDASVTVPTITEGEKEIVVTNPVALGKGTIITIPLNTKDITGDAKVTVDGWDTIVSGSEHIYARVSSANAIVTVKEEVPAFYTGTNLKVAKFTIEEAAVGSFDKNPKLTFTLDNDDFEITGANIEYSKGFSEVAGKPTPVVRSNDKQVVDIDFTGLLGGKSSRGVVEVELLIKNASGVRNPSLGDLNAEIAGKLVDDKSYKVATIAEYGVQLKAEKEYEFSAGQTKEVIFHLNETVAKSLAGGRATEFSLPEGVYFNHDAKVTDGDGVELAGISYEKDDDNRITGFVVNLPLASDATKINKFKMKAKLDIPADFEGDVVLTAEGRAIGQALEVVLAKVKAAIKVTVEPMTVKVGLKEQVGGKIVIEELEKGALAKAKDIFVKLETISGITLEDADVKVTNGDLRLGDVKTTTAGGITIPVKRESKVASTIEITNVKVRLDRTVPEGSYDISVGGAAISSLAEIKVATKAIYGNDNIMAKDFLFVGERYTRPVTVFTIGSNVYTLNGETMTMDAAAYIKDGRTMVPVRYLAYALGINEDSIKFNSGIVTIFSEDGKVIQLKNNDKNLVINGMTIPMVSAAEIVEGRTYVPVTEIGSVFGVTGTWDAEAQTATFK